MSYYIGVDVGTSSVRASAFKLEEGHICSVKSYVHPITIWDDTPNHYEQSSADIWNAVVKCIRKVIDRSSLSSSDIKGIGFDATCSLVVLDKNLQPISVSLSGDANRNIIMWMDHRASAETDVINSTGHRLLKYVGGKVSLEMEMPKILWLKRNLPTPWESIGALMDLPDFLTFKATGALSRSLCSLVCKWMYDASEGSLSAHHWDNEFLRQIGLDDLILNDNYKLGNVVLAPGQSVGQGLSESAAIELGLTLATPVGASLIDAHAGGIGMLVSKPSSLPEPVATKSKLGLICGTSTCHMIVNEKPVFVPGVWGPYFSAMVPDMWLSEGGQSATGKLIDHMITSHPYYTTLKESLNESSNLYEKLAEHAEMMASRANLPLYELTKHHHVMPDFHGNRSPLADPDMTGMVSGLTLARGLDDLARLYISTLQSLVMGTRQTVEALEASGHSITTVYMCGGLTKNILFVQMTADILNRHVIIPDESESVLLGAALLGICAQRDESLSHVIESVICGGTVYRPNSSSQDFYDHKYQVFKKMVNDQLCYRNIMNI